MMNAVQIATLVRQVLLILGGILISLGWVSKEVVDTLTDEATLVAIVGGAIALGTMVWGLYVRRKTALVATVADMPEVTTIKAEPKLAAAVPSNKVVRDTLR